MAPSGQAAKQLSHSKQRPQDRQRCASRRASASVSPAMTSANPASRASPSRRFCGVGSASLNTGRFSIGQVDQRRLGRGTCGMRAQPAVDVPRRQLAVADRDGDGALARHHVAAGEDAGRAGHHVGPDDHRAVGFHVDARHAAQEAAVGLLAERQHHRVGLQRLELAGRHRAAVGRDVHALDRQRAAGEILDGGEPADLHAFLDRLVGLERMRRHVRAVAAIDDHRLVGAEAAGGAGGVHGGVAAAVDHHAAAEQRRRRRLATSRR